MPSLKIPSAFSNRRFYCIFKPALTLHEFSASYEHDFMYQEELPPRFTPFLANSLLFSVEAP
jgi:hypothetical protein